MIYPLECGFRFVMAVSAVGMEESMEKELKLVASQLLYLPHISTHLSGHATRI